MTAYLTDFYRRDVERPSGADVSDILNYVGSGNSVGNSSTYGRIAGRNAAAYAKRLNAAA